MASKLTIWNKSLRKIGEARITSLTEDSVNARLLQDTYEEDKNAVLEMHSWKFARKEYECGLNGGITPTAWDHSYELPNDFIKIIYFNNTEAFDRQAIGFDVLGDTLLTNEDTAKIVYTSSTTLEGLFSPLFVEALTTYMAMNNSYNRTKSQPLMDRLSQAFERQLARAKVADSAMDTTPPPSRLSFPNVGARYSGTRLVRGHIVT